MNDNRHLVRAALASGEFKQTRATLQDEHGFCCLGVACIVAERHGVKVFRDRDGRLLGGGLMEYQAAVVAWLAIDSKEGSERVSWNDDKGHTFAQIAEVF